MQVTYRKASRKLNLLNLKFQPVALKFISIFNKTSYNKLASLTMSFVGSTSLLRSLNVL